MRVSTEIREEVIDSSVPEGGNCLYRCGFNRRLLAAAILK